LLGGMVTKYRVEYNLGCTQPPAVLSSLLYRIDIHIEVPAVDYEKLNVRRLGRDRASLTPWPPMAKFRQ